MLRKLTSALVLFFATALALPAQTSIWKVSRGGNYLLIGGSPSVIRHKDYPLPVEFDRAVDLAATVYLELDMERLWGRGVHPLIESRGLYHDGTTIDKVLTPKAWQGVRDYAQKHGLPTARLLNRKTPLIVSAIYSFARFDLGAAETDLDAYVYHRAHEAGKPLHSLEPLEHRLEAHLSAGAGHESEWVLAVLEEIKSLPQEVPREIADWRAGNSSLGSILLAEMHGDFPSEQGSVAQQVAERNQSWLPVIDRLVTSPEIEFVLVDTIYLVGPHGLLASLRQNHCRVEQWRPD